MKDNQNWASRTPKSFKGKHPDWCWVTINIPMTKREMIDFFGKECDSNDKECPSCRNWKLWKKTGRANVTVERKQLLE